MTSLFTRLAKFGFNPARDPKEERLTEAFAAALRATPEAARELVKTHMAGGSSVPSGPLTVSTQRQTDDGDRIDIELRFGSLAEPQALIWIELKWDSPPRAEQLNRYQAAIDRLGGDYRRAVCLIARNPPEWWHGVAWRDVGRTLNSWRQRAGNRNATLLSEFISYLEENRLTETQAFTLTDAIALNSYDRAVGRLRQVIDESDRQLMERMTPRAPDGRWGPKPNLDLHRIYVMDAGALSIVSPHDPKEAAPRTPLPGWDQHEGLFFEWHLRDDEERDDRARGEHVFGAGITCGAQDAFGGDEYGDWMRVMRKSGFEYVRGGEKGQVWYLMRFMYPGELIGGSDLDDQAERLKKFVTGAFADLALSPPRRDARPPAHL